MPGGAANLYRAIKESGAIFRKYSCIAAGDFIISISNCFTSSSFYEPLLGVTQGECSVVVGELKYFLDKTLLPLMHPKNWGCGLILMTIYFFGLILVF